MFDILNQYHILEFTIHKGMTNEERTAFLNDMNMTVTLNAVTHLLEDETISQIDKERLLNTLGKGEIDQEDFEYLQKNFPQLENYIVMESYLFKKTLLLEQLKELINSLDSEKARSLRTDLQYLVEQLIRDDGTFIPVEREKMFVDKFKKYVQYCQR